MRKLPDTVAVVAARRDVPDCKISLLLMVVSSDTAIREEPSLPIAAALDVLDSPKFINASPAAFHTSLDLLLLVTKIPCLASDASMSRASFAVPQPEVCRPA